MVENEYRVVEGCLVWDRGDNHYARPFHCPGTRAIFLASHRPAWMMKAEHVVPPSHLKLGECVPAIIIGTHFIPLYSIPACRAIDSGVSMEYNLDYKDARINCEFIPLCDVPGFICALSCDKDIPGVQFGWEYGGLDQGGGHSPWEPAQMTGQTLPLRPTWDTDTPNVMDIDESSFKLWMEQNPEVVVMGRASLDSTYMGVESPSGPRVRILLKEDIIGAEKRKAYLVVVWGKRGESLQDEIGRVLANSETEIAKTKAYFHEVSQKIVLKTPDERFHLALRRALLVCDACWYPPAMRLASNSYSAYFLIWRQLYGPTIAGWHDRVTSTLRFHGQHRNIPDNSDWDTSPHSNHSLKHEEVIPGRIYPSVDPLTNKAGGHWDAVQLYIDYIYHHYCWTGDIKLVKELWPVLVEAEKWQRAARNPDGDGLYVNVLNTYISDVHEYHQGKCIVASAYAYANNRALAEFARVLGEDDIHYTREAEKILKVIQQLWIKDKCIFAEYKDALGILHPDPETTSIYHPIQCGICTPQQASGLLNYARQNLLHPGGMARGNNWLPGVRMMYQVLPSETLDLAHSAYLGGDRQLGWTLLQGFVKALFDRANSYTGYYIPLTFQEDDGSVELLENASLFIRAIVEGVFGIQPRFQESLVIFRPQIPEEWKNASLRTPDAGLEVHRGKSTVEYKLWTRCPARCSLILPLAPNLVAEVQSEGVVIPWQAEPSHCAEEQFVRIDLPEKEGDSTISIQLHKSPKTPGPADSFRKPLRPTRVADHLPKPKDQWWHSYQPEGKCFHQIPLEQYFNEDFCTLLRRTPPEMHYGARVDKWSWGPRKEIRKIDDRKLRERLDGNILLTSAGIPFRIGKQDKLNSIFLASPEVALFQQGYLRYVGEEFYSLHYPAKMTIPMDIKTSAIFVLFAGMTSPMQSGIPTMRIIKTYSNGTSTEELWKTPGDFDSVIQHYSRHLSIPLGQMVIRPYWLNTPAYEINYQQEHLDVARIEIDKERRLASLAFEVLSLDTTLSVLALTVENTV